MMRYNLYSVIIDNSKFYSIFLQVFASTGPPQSPTMQLTANQVLQRHYIGFAEGFVMVYDTTRPESLDVLMYLKKDIERNKDKKEVCFLLQDDLVLLSPGWHETFTELFCDVLISQLGYLMVYGLKLL